MKGKEGKKEGKEVINNGLKGGGVSVAAHDGNDKNNDGNNYNDDGIIRVFYFFNIITIDWIIKIIKICLIELKMNFFTCIFLFRWHMWWEVTT